MYRIREFSAMTGLSQSKIRFYEKRGFLLSHREENGYRVFTLEDAFRSNAFRMLLQYGFSIEEAIELVDADQETQTSRASLSKFRLGTCVRLRRRLNRTESVRRSSFSELYDYLDTHGYKAKSDAIIFPSFLNLDSKNSDIEVIYVPIA